MNLLFDTHCHLNLPYFQDDLDDVIQRAIFNNVSYLLVPGIDLDSSIRAIKLCAMYPSLIYSAIGIHPNIGSINVNTIIDKLKSLAINPCVVAIGEIGLDYCRKITPVETQKQLLGKQLELALINNKPVIIHNREADDDLLNIMIDWYNTIPSNSQIKNRPGVFHSFSASLNFGKQIIDKGFFIGIGGKITFKSADNYRKLISQFPIKKIVLETDSPYLTPHPYRGKSNEPSYLIHIANVLAEIYHLKFDDVVNITTKNAKYLFDL